jgi:hypothetical protein
LVSSDTNDSQRFGTRFVDLATKEVKTPEAPPGYGVGVQSFSPTGTWAVVLLAKVPFVMGGPYAILLAPLQQDTLAPYNQWVAIPESSHFAWPQWSPDRDVLCFFNDVPEGHRIEAQPVDPLTGHPRGSRKALLQFDRPSFAWFDSAGLAVMRQSVIFSATEYKGNIWLKKMTTEK